MAAIDILMASYNGEKYIAEQIESLLGQTFTDWRLLIRDDGSSDNTPAIIESYAGKYPGKIQVIHDSENCRSATKNFFELLKHASADYVMFCDQDDVWLKYKIEITYDFMIKTESENPGRPVMVFTGLKVVDAELRSLDQLMSLDFHESRYTFRELIPCNCAAGCTQMLNRECWRGVGGFQEGILLHDWWTSLYAAAFGVIERVPMALILYRQHGDNVIGTEGETFSQIIMRYVKYPFARASCANSYNKSMALVFRERFSALMSPYQLNLINTYLEMFSRSIFMRFKALMKFRDIITRFRVRARIFLIGGR